MSTHQHHPLDRHLDRETAERLLSGRRVPSSGDPLAQRLAAAGAPPFPGELAGERAALAAFQAASVTVPLPRRKLMIQTALAKLLTLKVAAVVALSAGGVALAATTGVLPNPIHQDPPGAAHATGKPSEHPGAQATPSPSLVGLCHAFLAGAGAEHGKALDNPAFTVLITAAGGREQVEAFCADLLDQDSSPDPDGSTHPTGPPSAHPTGPSFPHPTGPPSPMPNQ